MSVGSMMLLNNKEQKDSDGKVWSRVRNSEMSFFSSKKKEQKQLLICYTKSQKRQTHGQPACSKKSNDATRDKIKTHNRHNPQSCLWNGTNSMLFKCFWLHFKLFISLLGVLILSLVYLLSSKQTVKNSLSVHFVKPLHPFLVNSASTLFFFLKTR